MEWNLASTASNRGSGDEGRRDKSKDKSKDESKDESSKSDGENSEREDSESASGFDDQGEGKRQEIKPPFDRCKESSEQRSKRIKERWNLQAFDDVEDSERMLIVFAARALARPKAEFWVDEIERRFFPSDFDLAVKWCQSHLHQVPLVVSKRTIPDASFPTPEEIAELKNSMISSSPTPLPDVTFSPEMMDLDPQILETLPPSVCTEYVTPFKMFLYHEFFIKSMKNGLV